MPNELSQILENSLTNMLSNLFLYQNSYSKESYYSDKYVSYWKGFSKIGTVRKVPVNARRIIFTEDTIYISLSLGVDRNFEGKTYIYTYKQEHTTLICEILYIGVLDNIMNLLQSFIEKEIQPALLYYHQKVKPLIVEGEKVMDKLEEFAKEIENINIDNDLLCNLGENICKENTEENTEVKSEENVEENSNEINAEINKDTNVAN